MSKFEDWINSTTFVNRGFYNNDEVPENSLKAINLAIQKNFGICIEVRALADGTIVVFNDATLGRMTNSDGFIYHSTLHEINELSLLNSSEKIPTLTEVLDLVNGQVPIIINIKTLDEQEVYESTFEKYVWKTLQGYKGDYAIASANPYTLAWFKENAPKVKRGQISSLYKNSILPFKVKFKYKRMKLNYLSEPNFIMYKASDLPNRFIKKIKDLPILANHVYSQEVFEKSKKQATNFIYDDYYVE